jgi:hypothetical protein
MTAAELAALDHDELQRLAYEECDEAAYDEMERRRLAIDEGLALKVSGPVNAVLYARDFREFNGWIASYRAKGCDVNAILPPMPHLAA